ncbi:MAG: YhfC family intramembrane metalloprotease [Anaerolineales bacterium]|nr:YhfC family intramembrane metalloprotease [Anaerolineales bacterium]
MCPLDLIGVPDWRSAIIAVVLTAPWLVLLARGRLRHRALWLIVEAAALLFPLSIAWVQVPIQQGLGVAWQRVLSPEVISRYLVLIGMPSIVVSGLVQEVVKFALAALGLRLMRDQRGPCTGLAVGAAAGAGYGAMEAFWVANSIFAAGFTWATVQIGGPWGLIGFIERFFTVMLHVGVSALAGYGLAAGQPWRYLLLAIGLHALANTSALLLQTGRIGLLGAEGMVAVIAVAALGAALWLRNQALRQPEPAQTAPVPAEGEGGG